MKQSILAIILSITLFIMTTSAAPVLEKRLKSCYKHATFTQYWIPKQGDRDMLNNGDVITLSGPKTKKLKTKHGKVIASVDKKTYEKFQMEGTGLLLDGTMVNLDTGKNTFLEVNRKKTPYGLGSDDDIGLEPWVSVASNDLDVGETLYIKELDGTKLPDGKTHNGCVRVDDEGWSFDGCQLDFFVLQYTAYTKLEKIIPEHVTVKQKKCKVLNYVTSAVKSWAELK
ncbi:unnamed protein product [Cunninghamella blakesleeana]